MLRLLTRSATNTYFPQVTRVISLPTSVDQLAELVRSVWSALQSCSSTEDVKLARRFNPQVAATLEGYPDEEVWSRIAVMRRSDDQEDQAENPRLAEFAMLASGQPVIGTRSTSCLAASGSATTIAPIWPNRSLRVGRSKAPAQLVSSPAVMTRIRRTVQGVDKINCCGNEGGDPALHVQGAAAVELAVLNRAGEGI